MTTHGHQSSSADPVTQDHPTQAATKKTKNDLFEKCWSFTRADEIKAAGYYPYFRPIEENEGPVVTIEGKKVIMAGSNNYLGLTADPRVKEAAKKAIDKYGTGCSGSRYLTGTLDLHIELGGAACGVLWERGMSPLQHRLSDRAGDHPDAGAERGVRGVRPRQPRVHRCGKSDGKGRICRVRALQAQRHGRSPADALQTAEERRKARRLRRRLQHLGDDRRSSQSRQGCTRIRTHGFSSTMRMQPA